MLSMINTTSPLDKANSCIYCGGTGPFSKEHIFCAGLGGDDGQFILHDLVCKQCNTERFSPMEAEFMRNSAESFTRILVQPRGRKRKGDDTPKFRPSSIRVFLPNGTLAEAAMRPRGEIVILPQYALVDNQLQGQCGYMADMTAFVEQLSSLLVLDVVYVVTKTATLDRPQYAIMTSRWTGERYEADGHEIKLNVPEPCIWRDVESNTEPADPRSRIFLRPEGQIVIRLEAQMPEAEFLTLLRKHLGEMQASASQARKGTPIFGAAVGVRLQRQVGLRERVMAKIGVNLSARVFGEDYVRHVCFDKIKASILTGEPEVFSTLHRLDEMAPDEFLVKMFATTPKHNHFCALTAVQIPEGSIELIFCIQLYGGIVTMLRLAQDLPTPLPTLPIFMFVDYVNHRIKLADSVEFTTQYMFPNLALAAGGDDSAPGLGR